MYGEKAKLLFESLKAEGMIGAFGEINFELLNTKVIISDKSSVGNLLQEWLSNWMDSKKIFHRSNVNSQMPPDFYLSEKTDRDWLEVKSFDYDKSPNFDVANFDAYVRDIKVKSYRLDADYLIIGYTLNSGVVKINNMWLKKIWEITCPSAQYSLRLQVKQDKIYNIRPYNFKSVSAGFQPFKDRLGFVVAIKETIAKYRNSQTEANEWFETVKKSYNDFSGLSL